MVLDLEVEVVAEDLLVGERPLAGLVGLALEVHARDDARHARGAADDALVVAAQHLERGARVVVEHVAGGGLRHHLHEVDVARLVLGEQQQVVAVLLGALLDAVVGDEVGLAAEDGLDEQRRPVGLDGLEVVRALPDGHVGLPLRVDAVVDVGVGRVGLRLLELPALLEALDVVLPLAHVALLVVVLAALQVEVRDAEHVAVVGEREGRHLEVDRALHHVRHARGRVEDGEVRVVVEVDECHVLIAPSLSRVHPPSIALPRDSNARAVADAGRHVRRCPPADDFSTPCSVGVERNAASGERGAEPGAARHPGLRPRRPRRRLPWTPGARRARRDAREAP